MSWWCSAQGVPWTWEWRAYPGVWLFVGGILATYGWALLRLPPARMAGDDAPTSVRDVVLFGCGVLAIWAVSDWPLGALAAGHLLSLRVLQYLVFVLVAPPLLLLGTPRWLLRRALRRRGAFRIARLLTRPLAPLVVYNVVLIAAHLPTVVGALATSQWGSFGLHVAVLGSGLAFWWPALGRLPELRPMRYPGRIGYLALAVFVPTVPASFFTFARYPIYAIYELAPRVGSIDPVTDQQVAGLLMKLGGGAILFGTMSVMFFRWYRREEAVDLEERKETVA